MADLRDILSGNDEQLNEDELVNYLNDNLSEQDKHAIEEKMAGSPFVNDAVDGLKEFKSKQQLNDTIKQLNKSLEKQLAEKKLRKSKHEFKDLPLLLLTAIIILLICIVGYFVIHLYYQHANNPSHKDEHTITNMR